MAALLLHWWVCTKRNTRLQKIIVHIHHYCLPYPPIPTAFSEAPNQSNLTGEELMGRTAAWLAASTVPFDCGESNLFQLKNMISVNTTHLLTNLLAFSAKINQTGGV
jgi:hypothetical protein